MALPLLAVGCGAKTELGVEERHEDGGRGLDAGSDAGAPDAGPDAGPDATVCVPGRVRLVASTVEVVFVIDRSGSMLAAFDGRPPTAGEESRWELLETALSDALSVFDERIGVGAKFFPSRSERTIRDDCAVFDGLDVPIGPGHADGMISHFHRWNPAGGTPLAPAIREALEALQTRESPDSAQFIVVATDGAPTCSRDAVAQAQEVIRESHEDHGVDVYMLGMAATEREVDRLDVLAIEGGRPRPAEEERRFYDARDPELLRSLLREIATDLTQCAFRVPIPPGEDDTVEVLVAGERVEHDEERRDGWDWTSESQGQLSLFGQACERAIASGGAVRADIACNE